MAGMALRKYANLNAFRLMDKALFLRFLTEFPENARIGALIVRIQAYLDSDAAKEPKPPRGAAPRRRKRADASADPASAVPVPRTIDDDLFDFFSKLEPDLSPKLIAVLHKLDDLSNDDGHDRLIDQLRELRTSTEPYDEDIDVRSLAMRVFLENPMAFDRAHDRVVIASANNPRMYDSRWIPVVHPPTDEQCRAIEFELSATFFEGRRGDYCRIRTYVEDDDVAFVVEHGDVYRAMNVLARDPTSQQFEPSVTPLRPLRQDAIRYTRETGRLEVSAGQDAHREAYRKALGLHWFGSAGWFTPARGVTLLPLRDAVSIETFVKPIDGQDLISIRLTELCVGLGMDSEDSRTHRKITIRSPDVTKEQNIDIIRHMGIPIKASFRIRLKDDPSPRGLGLALADLVFYDKRYNWPAVKAWLEAKGLLVPPNADDDGNAE